MVYPVSDITIPMFYMLITLFSYFLFQLGDFTITLKAPDRNKHFRIHVENNNYNIGQQSFDSIDDLVEHYKKHPIYKHEVEKLYLLRAFSHHES